MTFRVTIDCDNAAFEESPGQEIARILTKIANKIDEAQDGELPTDGLERCEMDYNGNKVAYWYYV